MEILWICVGVAAALILITFILFLTTFGSFPKHKPLPEGKYDIPKGKAYRKHRDQLIEWQKSVRAMPRELVEITSFDGLKLRGYYYEYKKGAPIEIQFHGYHGNGERDLSGGVERCFAVGRSVIIVDQRGHGMSDGRIITFGVKEKFDCIKWVEYAVERFGSDVKLILTGVSMGAATVILAAAEKPMKNVIGVLADCGYSSAEAIIKKVIKDVHLPASLIYPLVYIGARVFGGFDLRDAAPIEAVKRITVPIIFYHGDSDRFVPCQMSKDVFDACPMKEKHLTVVKDADHGLAYPTNKQLYIEQLQLTINNWYK